MYVILMIIMVVGLIVLLEKLADIDSSNNGNTTYNEQGQKCCPYCGSTHFQYAGQQIYGARPEKTKTRYTANLNPLRPFTLVNKKEKVVKKARSGYAVDEFICLNCGNRFR
ncbi:hypothetical protein [Agathobacter sp.]|jgi:hypothetical protein|uniref:hypothetical protein n=1 Tax=Agathobacter sp. TaxID=2021311 RepID=UPI00280A5DD8|nr:hypothetical protein [Agathobacter sp.]